MHFIKPLGLVAAVTLALTLTACGNPAMEVVPTPTPRDAALERLFQSQQQAEAVAGMASGAVAETASGTQAQIAAETQVETTPSEAASSSSGGEQVFTANGCIACHSLEPGTVLVGPSLAQIGSEAAERIAAPDYTGQATTPEEYIHESIVNPMAYVVPDFVPAMPPTYEQTIPPEQLDQLVSYLASLK